MFLFYMYFLTLFSVYSSGLSFPRFFAIRKLNGINYKNLINKLSDNHLVNVCFESNIIDVLLDTWWLNSSATIHACNSIQAIF